MIVGGGPAGAAAGIRLAQAGASPWLVERSPGPREVVCGGFLGWDALALLERLGLDAAALGARPIQVLRLVSPERSIEINLPRAGAGLSRRRLDEALLVMASEAGVRVERGRAVRSVELSSRTAFLDDGEEMSADSLFLANGKHELRGAARQPARARSQGALGLRIALQACPRLDDQLSGTLELYFFDGGYAGVLAQEDGTFNLCLSAAPSRLKKADGIEAMLDCLALEHPSLGERLAHSRIGTWEAIAGVPYGWRARRTLSGVFRLGDQAAVIASLAGDGIAIALRSGMMAAAAMLEQGPLGAEPYQRRFAREAAAPLKTAALIRSAAEQAAIRRPAMSLIAAFPGVARLAARLTRIA